MMVAPVGLDIAPAQGPQGSPTRSSAHARPQPAPRLQRVPSPSPPLRPVRSPRHRAGPPRQQRGRARDAAAWVAAPVGLLPQSVQPAADRAGRAVLHRPRPARGGRHRGDGAAQHRLALRTGAPRQSLRRPAARPGEQHRDRGPARQPAAGRAALPRGRARAAVARPGGGRHRRAVGGRHGARRLPRAAGPRPLRRAGGPDRRVPAGREGRGDLVRAGRRLAAGAAQPRVHGHQRRLGLGAR